MIQARWGRILVGAVALTAFACGGDPPDVDEPESPPARTLGTSQQISNTDELLQAVSPVDGDTVWVSGHGGTYVRTLDGGETWVAAVVPGEEELQFRDVAAFSSRTAYLMSAGEGALSRVYRTDDGGDSWTLQYTADHPQAFLDCMDFWSPQRGLVYGDAVDGVPFILRTEDGGSTWSRVPAEGLPAALDGEGGFAASGTCLHTGPEGRAWIAAGNAEVARVLRTDDWGATWSVAESPVVAGSASGHTTLQMTPGGQGIVLGGIIGNDTTATDNVAVTTDGGATWTLAARPAMPGPVYGSALAADSEMVVAVGPRGLAWSQDFGRSWNWADTATYWAAAFADDRTGWAVGPQGAIMRLAVVGR